MKSCPTCNRTYPDDSLAFCLMDGSVLSAPFDPAATQPNASARESSPPRTEVLNAAPQPQPLPETRAAAPPPIQPTITAPPPVVPQVQARERSHPRAVASGQSGIVAKVLVTVAILIGVSVLGVFLVRSLSRKRVKSDKVDVTIRAPSNTRPQNDSTSPTGSTSSTTAANAPISLLGDLSSFKKITQDCLDLVNRSDLAGAKTRVADLEYEWDNSQARLKPMNVTRWTEIDAAVDKVLRELRAVSPNAQSSKSALVALLVVLNKQ